MKNRLEHILTPFSLTDFFEKYLEKECLHIPRNEANYFNEAMTIEDIDTLFQYKFLPQQLLRVANFKAGINHYQAPVLKSSYFLKWNNALDNEAFFKLFTQEGTSLILNKAQDYLPKLGLFMSELEHELQFLINANIYLSPPNTQAFEPHYDNHDTFVLQILGHKTWYLYDSMIDLPDAKQKNKKKIDFSKYTKDNYKDKIEVKPGDTLYVPRGWGHCVVSTDSPSLHITIGFHPKKQFDIVENMADLVKEAPNFRKAFPHYATTTEKIEFVDQIKTDLIQFVQNISSEKLVEEIQKEFITSKSNHFTHRFRDLFFKDQITESTQFQIRKGLSYQIELELPTIKLRFGQKVLPYPFFFKPIIDFIGKGNSFTINDLPTTFSANEKVKLMKLLLQEGFLTIDSY